MAKTRLPPSDPDDVDPHDFVITPPPKTGVLTVILCVLNILAAFAFMYCLMEDFGRRQAWARAAFLQDVVSSGMPLAEEDAGLSLSQAAAPNPELRSDDLREVYGKRTSSGPMKEPFIAVEDFPPTRIAPKLFNEDNLKEVYGDLDKPSVTLEDEIQRIKESLFQDLAAAVKEAVAAEKTADDKRKRLEKILLPQAFSVKNTRELDKLIRSADDADLDKLLADAVERRMILDILEPVEYTRPSRPLEVQGGMRALQLKDLQDKLRLRLDNAQTDNYMGLNFGEQWDKIKRDSIEKRLNIVYLIFTIAHVTKPDGSLLYERGPERAQIVMGVEKFNWAAQEYNEALKRLYESVVERIVLERDGVAIPEKDALVRAGGFVQRHQELVKKIRYESILIAKMELSLKLKNTQRDAARQMYEDREKERQARVADLIAQRARTAKLLAELQGMQQRLFLAQLELADAAKINEDLEREIRAWERERFRIEGLIIEGGEEAMIFNLLGKFMVQCHLVISVGALTWAAAVYLEFIDWGKKVPRKELDYAYASAIDKSTARTRVALRKRDLVYPGLKSNYLKLRDAEEAYVQNTLFYDKEMARLASDPDPIEIKEIKFDGGRPELMVPPGVPIGRPEFQEKPLADLNKSRESYREDLKKLGKETDLVEKEYIGWIEKQKEVTLKLNGLLDENMKKVKAGLIEMRQAEVDAHRQLQDEIRYLRPREINFRKEAEIYRERREILEEAIKRAKQGLGKNAKIGGPG